uniref:Uncharacterized protein n=1 Tax=Siphoviridae sp. ctGyV19 TaxID=2826225 RepID=A0A8S5MVA6_9CAUD|nr:MAG TPA: hypothetical protein [Siphoviridae sp. ctGyV19]
MRYPAFRVSQLFTHLVLHRFLFNRFNLSIPLQFFEISCL